MTQTQNWVVCTVRMHCVHCLVHCALLRWVACIAPKSWAHAAHCHACSWPCRVRMLAMSNACCPQLCLLGAQPARPYRDPKVPGHDSLLAFPAPTMSRPRSSGHDPKLAQLPRSLSRHQIQVATAFSLASPRSSRDTKTRSRPPKMPPMSRHQDVCRDTYFNHPAAPMS